MTDKSPTKQSPLPPNGITEANPDHDHGVLSEAAHMFRRQFLSRPKRLQDTQRVS